MKIIKLKLVIFMIYIHESPGIKFLIIVVILVNMLAISIRLLNFLSRKKKEK